MAKVGRPSKLTPELQTEITNWLKLGNFVETVCDFVGIHPDTYYEWMKRGERGWKIDIDGGYVAFSEAVKKAQAQVEMTTVADLRTKPNNWQADAWWLERRHPSRWGNRSKHTISGPDDGPVEVVDASTARERIAGRIAGLAARFGTGSDAEKPDGKGSDGT